MSTERQDELLDIYRKLYAEFQSDTAAMLFAGIIPISSDSRCDANGNVTKRGGASLIQPFRPNLIQRQLEEVRAECLRSGHKFNLHLLKSRGVGGTTWANGHIVSTACTVSGSRGICISHEPKSTEIIYGMARTMLAGLPAWIRPDTPWNSAERIGAENPQWGLRDASIQNVHCEALDAIRGNRCITLFKDESSRYDNPDEVSEATNSLVLDTPTAMNLEITTSNGHDGHFYPAFTEEWEIQGSRNFWEDGAKRFKRQAVAAFFPFFWDLRKRAKVPRDLGYAWLKDDLDEYEQWLYAEHLLPFVKKNIRGDSGKTALEFIYWRRSKIMTEYRYMDIKADVSTQVRTKEQFCREEPVTVEEAFDVTGEGIVIPEQIRDEIRTRDVLPFRPIIQGVIRDGRPMDWNCPEDNYIVTVWKDPEKIKGRLVAAIDPSAGLIEDERATWTNDRDYTEGHIFEDRGDYWEEVAQYVNQRPSRVCSPQFHCLLSWLVRGEKKRLPELGIERAHGMDMIHYFRTAARYPTHKIYREIKDERANRQQLATWGFWPSENRHNSAVTYWADMICQGRMRIHSPRLLFQMGNFIQVKDKKYEARAKGKRGANSKDDGIDACCIAAYMIEYGGPRPSEIETETSEYMSAEEVLENVARPPDGVEDVREFERAYLAAQAAGVNYRDLRIQEELDEGLARVTSPFDPTYGGVQ